MAKAEKYDDLIFQLGDLAREVLPNKVTCPRSMERVYKAEDVVLARRDELAALEQQMNEEDETYRAYLEELAAERAEQERIVKQYRRAVDAIQGRVKELRGKIGKQRLQVRDDEEAIAKLDRRTHDLEMETVDPVRIQQARELLKRMRLSTMRKQRDLEELEREFDLVLTPQPGQPGSAGILAHKRLLILEDEAEERRLRHEEVMADLDRQIAAKDEEVKAAEEFLDQAVFLLGEDVYANRIADPGLAALYPRLDRAQ